MVPERPKRHRAFRTLLPAALLVGLLSAGCGNQYVLFHPAGPVARIELNMMIWAFVVMGIVIVFVLILLGIVLARFRDKPDNKAPYMPDWHGHKLMEVLWLVIPAIILAIIAVPTVKQTYALAHLPKSSQPPLVIDVTSLSWKWLFQYPGQHIATVNYAVIPSGRPVLFELTANSAMNTFWVPQLGGMEYTMPNRVLPLWLEADKPGSYWGHSGQFSGLGFDKMFFTVKSESPSAFASWAKTTHATASPMTMADYHQLLKFSTVGKETYSSYPAGTFPKLHTGFTLKGGMYIPMKNGSKNAY